MKLNKIALGIATVFGIAASPAHALLATSYTNGSEFVGDTQNVRISGATAQDPGLLAASLRLCTAGTMTAYSISNNFVYFCTADATKFTPRAGATKLAIYKYSVGGSGSGVGFVNNATAIPFMDLTKLATACTAGSATADADGTATNLSSYQVFACTAASSSVTTNALSYIGISDVEPQFFGPPSTYNNLNAAGLASVIFGVPVTKVAYEKLQTAQGKAVGGLLEVDMPSLSGAQISSMYTQEGQTWAGLTGVEVNAADDVIYVARRADTSGTQKSFEAVVARSVNGTPQARQCGESVEPFVSGVAALDNTVVATTCNGSNIVVNGSGSGQVLACLNLHNDGGRGAVGVLSTEYKQVAAGKLRFVKINGLAPTHANVAAGLYTAYTDASLNTRIGDTSPTALAPGYEEFITAFKAAFANPITIAQINAGNQTFGPSGLMALDNLVSPVPAADYTGASGRNPWSRLVGGTDLNNCQNGKAAAF